MSTESEIYTTCYTSNNFHVWKKYQIYVLSQIHVICGLQQGYVQ